MVIERKRHMHDHQGSLRHLGMILKRCDGRSNPVFYATPHPFSARMLIQSPASALKLLLIPLVLYINWEFWPHMSPRISPTFCGRSYLYRTISQPLLQTTHVMPRYLYLVFVAYYIIFFSFVRPNGTISLCRPLARHFAITKQTKIADGEQGHALVYFGLMGGGVS